MVVLSVSCTIPNLYPPSSCPVAMNQGSPSSGKTPFIPSSFAKVLNPFPKKCLASAVSLGAARVQSSCIRVFYILECPLLFDDFCSFISFLSLKAVLLASASINDGSIGRLSSASKADCGAVLAAPVIARHATLCKWLRTRRIWIVVVPVH